MKISDPGFQSRFIADCIALEDQGLYSTLVLDAGMTMVLIANLQLALRHPGNKGPGTRVVKKVVLELIERVSATETIRQGLMAGFDPTQDIPGL